MNYSWLVKKLRVATISIGVTLYFVFGIIVFGTIVTNFLGFFLERNSIYPVDNFLSFITDLSAPIFLSILFIVSLIGITKNKNWGYVLGWVLAGLFLLVILYFFSCSVLGGGCGY